jgi:CubicO group peptidase (beta-lactamase class C family)
MFNLRGGRVSYYNVGVQYRQQFDPTVTDEVVNALRNNPAYKVPGGGLIATPSDLARFGAAHFAPGLVGAHYEQLFTLQTTADGEATPVGLGWRVDRDEAGRLRYHHAGNPQGARAVVLVYPEQQVSVSVMTNLGGTPRDILGVAAGVAEGFLAD